MNALVVGGNSGLGLSIVCNLAEKEYDNIFVVGKEEINYSNINEPLRSIVKSKVLFFRANFINDDYSLFDSIKDINAIFITTGFGRATLFENLKDSEIDNLIKVNLKSAIKIIKKYYYKINSKNDFYTAVVSSICGHVVSPFFSVYSSTKAGLRFFIESVNCELRSKNLKNRILEVSPGSINGTNFNGGQTDLSLIESLANEIIEKTMQRQTLFVPHYDEIYRNVIKKYIDDPIKFGLDSYNYKLENNRINNNPQVVVGYLSGTFDLFHVGHLNLLQRAKEQCDYLIVSVHNSGAWKGKETFIPYEERKRIVASIKYVDKVVEDFIEDSDAWEKYHFDKLFVGSDYKGTERFDRYEKVLKGKAEIIYFPYTDGTSSTQLRDKIKKS